MTTEDDVPIILNSEIQKLPFRCLAAISYRALLRSFEVLDVLHNETLAAKPQQMVEELIDRLRRLAESSPRVADATQVVPWNLLHEFNAVLDSIPVGTPQRFLFVAACDATRVDARKVNEVVGHSMHMYREDASERRQLEFRNLLASAAHHDFTVLKAAIDSGEIDASTAIGNDRLGDLWPGGEPELYDF